MIHGRILNDIQTVEAGAVIAYHEKFGRHVPARVLRLLDAAPILQDALDTGVPLSETGWGRVSPIEFSPRGCMVRDERPEPVTPTNEPDGEWLQ